MTTLPQEEHTMYEDDAQEGFDVLGKDLQIIQNLLSTNTDKAVAEKLQELLKHNGDLMRVIANLRSQAAGGEMKAHMFGELAKFVR